MRDGVVLRADVYRPDRAGPWPTLLARTPYDKNDLGGHVWCGLDPMQAARAGFMVVVQDVRGRCSSEGDWEPYRYERLDGHDTVQWAAKLAGSNGRVGMYSGSYCGNAQWLAAAAQPSALQAISPSLTWSDPFDGLLARGGAAELGVSLLWALGNGFDVLRRRSRSDRELHAQVDVLVHDCDRLGEAGYWELPLDDLPVLRRHGVPDLGAMRVLEKPEVGDWCQVVGAYDQIEVPSLHTAGWYDIFLQGTLDNYQAMASAGKDARLVVGPWTHHAFADPIGEQLFGMRASRTGVPGEAHSGWNDLQLAWFARHLRPDPELELPERPVRIFVMGRNEWRDESSWPPERAVNQRWFLCSDGRLDQATPEPGKLLSTYVYDPKDPVPTVGGNGALCPGYASGPADQAAVEARADVLVFTSEPISSDLEVTGRVRVVLHAESSAPSTDWVARLCDVYPDGRSVNLCDGILRVPQDANECRRCELDLWSTSNVFLRGHRIRVHVTSSSFPRWDRNLNTGNQRDRRHQAARQRIYHSPDRPSYIELPVLRRGA